MNAFVQGVKSQETRTTNGMRALTGSANRNVDLFYKIGGMRGQDPVPAFVAALTENEDLALRIMLWARDVRGGAGERELFRKVLSYLETNQPELAKKLLPKVPELGRWDDLFVFKTKELKEAAFTLLGDALRAKNGLAAKWTPRKGKLAEEIRAFFGMTPKQYRKSLVALTKVVEQQMCAKDWDNINFSHVPSVASSRYKKAFLRRAPEAYKSYIEKLTKGDTTVKINASSIFPYDVLRDIFSAYGMTSHLDKTVLDSITAQWNALPNYVGDKSVLAMVDVSGSMYCPVGGQKNLTCAQVALSLGLYTADKNRGPFKDTFLTFSGSPELMHLNGNIVQKLQQMSASNWGMNTNIIAAFRKILKVAKDANAPQEDMPATVIIFSDMQFDACAKFDRSAMESIEAMYAEAGYKTPGVVFWNLHDSGNVPVKSDKSGAALLSGFSPAVMTSVLAGEDYTPESIMLRTVLIDRYSLD